MQAPFLHGGLSFTVTCSIGIALHPLDGHTLDELLTRADAAMSSVKEAGRASFRFHQARFDAEAVDGRSRLRLDHAMRLALPAHHFQLHYQPQVDMRTGAVGSVEALIRWHDPVLGDVSPGEFIPVAEESGFIVAIGAWVLREAVRQAAEWQRTGLPLVVSVNVSALQFQQEGFVDSVATALRQAELAPEWLELELTESILVQDVNQALQRLNMLARLGVKLAIDDFGTGYSSLAYLKRFPIDRLKIDRSFVNGLPTDESDVGIASAIVNMARALRLEVVAEGVETAAQAQFLREAGCDQYQGFLYSRALPAAELRARLSAP
jgi:EAL domain-containing protein (putative c-di-GMP-specific phosphodiesterase class I)